MKKKREGKYNYTASAESLVLDAMFIWKIQADSIEQAYGKAYTKAMKDNTIDSGDVSIRKTKKGDKFGLIFFNEKDEDMLLKEVE